jgi:hypothetical protein
MKSHRLILDPDDHTSTGVRVEEVLPGEVDEAAVDLITIHGSDFRQPAAAEHFDVLLILKGKARFRSETGAGSLSAETIVRPSYNLSYDLSVKPESALSLLRVRRFLNGKDLEAVRNHPGRYSELYLKRFADCPVYTEEIKSAKSINRMILPEGWVPRLCLGSVFTPGPDSVEPHEHPMLDQLFLGLSACRGICHANGDRAELSENVLLHVPLGSKHSLFVAEGDSLNYLWLDFFFTAEGQKYMDEQHTMVEE